MMDLATVLPDGSRYSVVLMRTNAYQCKPLKISKKKPLTLKVKHMLLLSERPSGRIVLGIEIYVYLAFQESQLERHIFVSKADTTGLGTRRVSAAGVAKCFLNYLISLDPTVYLNGASYRKSDGRKSAGTKESTVEGSAHEASGPDGDNSLEIVCQLRSLSNELKRKAYVPERFYKGSKSPVAQESQPRVTVPNKCSTRVSLFTRSANAYLFPQSELNQGKHVADGGELFKWWISILDSILDDSWSCKADIPGSDRNSVGKFLPRRENWSIGNIYVSEASENWAVRSIPLFPDDPKGRFLEHLIVENRYKAVSTGAFWEELGFRQEFRLGNVVGIIGCCKENVSGGVQEDSSTSMLTPKQYKKMREYIKGENYSKPEDVVNLWTSGMAELAASLEAKVNFFVIAGTKANGGPGISPVSAAHEKRKVQPVNNLSSLVKRKKK